MSDPYYDDGTCVIYHGDCREIDPGEVSAVVSDPPYGIGWNPRVNHKDSPWRDAERPDLGFLLAIGVEHCFWGGNYFADQLPASEAWLLWIKRPAAGFDDDRRSYSVCEMAWSNFPGKVRVKHHVWDGGKRAGDASNRTFCHPAQKPLEIMRWTLQQSDTLGTVLDPFMGSGTTLRAAKDLGRKAIGIEIEERYCEIAAKRLAQEVLDFGGTR